MMRSILMLLMLLCAARPAASGPARGHLVIVGGGTIPDEVYSRALALAGGVNASVAVFPQASELADTGERAVERWRKAGASKAVSVSLKDAEAAMNAVQEASLIWFPGGDQNRLMKAFAGTGVPEAILKRYRDGATVGGTSAGAAVMSSVMITGDADLQSITSGATKSAPGLALLPEAVVDQHFLKRQRQSRLISLVLDHPELLGIGIDEQTAIVVTGSRFEVVGRSSVVVIDARRGAVDRRSAGQLAAGQNLRMHVLTDGMAFDFKKR